MNTDNYNIETFSPLYEYNENLDRFINTLIDHFDELKNIIVSEYEITVTYKHRTFSLWIENKFYGYLKCVIEFEYTNDGKCKILNIINNKQPSKKTIQRFYQEVELKLGASKDEIKEEWLNI